MTAPDTAPDNGLDRSVDIGHDPRTGAAHEPVPHSPPAEVAAALSTAAATAPAVAATSPATRAAWLGALADAMEAHADELVDIADSETALGSPRLPGELAKAAAQARFYGSVADEGSVFGATIDHEAGSPAVDLRRVRVPLGPVAVFGASNFPFGFGVAGHDTCSALAAGCPVVVKAHPAHPRLSVRLGEIVTAALAQAGAPEGTFGLVVGFDAGLALVDAPEITAVGFTGSQAGGMALVERAAHRGLSENAVARPIPVYAEMGTVNPAVVTTAGARERAEDIARGFVDSFTLGAGQFCTKPGLLLVPAGSALPEVVAREAATRPSAWSLTGDIAQAYAAGLTRLYEAGARVVSRSEDADTASGFTAPVTTLVADAADLQPGSPLLEECFGPTALVIEYADAAERDALIARLQPSLAAAVATAGPDDPETPQIVALLTGQVGRVVVDGWPTGVAGTWAQHHGGPWPATSRPEATSVGAGALDRWLRPVAFQDVPDSALPQALRDTNPWGLPRRVDGRFMEGRLADGHVDKEPEDGAS